MTFEMLEERGRIPGVEAEFDVPERDPVDCHNLHCFLCRASQDAYKRLKFCIVDLISILHELLNFEAN
jgi:hypothetical protein